MENPNPSLEITADQVTALVNYLASRPWREANGLIVLLSQLKPIKNGATASPVALVPDPASTADSSS